MKKPCFFAKVKGHFSFAPALLLFFLISSCAGTGGAGGIKESASTGRGAGSLTVKTTAAAAAGLSVSSTAEKKKRSPKPDVEVKLPPSSGDNPFAGNVYAARNFKADFLDGSHLTLWLYNAEDECWQKELSLSYCVNASNKKLYAKVDAVYEEGEKLTSAKSLYRFLWPPLKKKYKADLSSSAFDSRSKKNFINFSMENLEASSHARFERLYDFSYRLLDGGKKLELTSSLETDLSRVTERQQLIARDKEERVQLAFTNLTVQFLSLKKGDSLPECFFIGNLDFLPDEKKVSAAVFRIGQKEEKGRTVFESMQEAGLFEAQYSVKSSVNAAAKKQHFSVYDCVYSFTVTSMPEGMPPLARMEMPVCLHADKYVLKKEQK